MNERIRELAEQTGYIWHASGDPQIYEFTPEKLAKFAELIVRQMLEITAAHTEVFQTDRDRAVIEHIKKSVKQHFGVEE